MKTTAILFVTFFLQVARGFLANQPQKRAAVGCCQTKRANEIYHELEELGDVIHHQVMTNDAIHGFDEMHDTKVHTLRKKVRDLKHQWQEDRKHLMEVEERLHQLEIRFEYNELGHEIESELKEEEEEESIRKLLGKAIRLGGRRIKNGLKRVFRFGHQFP